MNSDKEKAHPMDVLFLVGEAGLDFIFALGKNK